MSVRQSVERSESTSLPLGVKAICAFNCLGILLGFLRGFVALVLGVVGYGLVLVGVATVLSVITHGLWTGRRWAWFGALGFYALGALFALAAGGLLVIRALILVAFILYLLVQQHVFL